MNRTCPNKNCPCQKGNAATKISPYGYYKTKAGKRRRFRCQVCRTTLSSTSGTPYYRIQHSRSKFNQVASLSVEGVNKSAISRVQSVAWNTVHRWLEKAAKSCRQFTRNNTRDMDIREIQADEIRTFTGNKKKALWIFATMDVWSRFWPGTVIGSRNYDNTKSVIQSISKLTNPQRVPLITSDGYKFYERAIRKCFGKCLYGQVIKTRRNDRVTKVDRRMIIGDKRDFEKVLQKSEDSETLNTSFIERLNLTIRQSTSYLTRRTTCFARFQGFLEKQLNILRCHYNFLRPHRALKFGPEIRTPAMQAGLAKRRFTFRDVFTFLISIIWIRKLESSVQSEFGYQLNLAWTNT
jgi:IS1 family transposase/transposase-like protein